MKTPARSTSTSTSTATEHPQRNDDINEALVAEYGCKAELAQQRSAVSEQQLPEPVRAEPVIGGGERVTSPELASLAGEVVALSDAQMHALVMDPKPRLEFFAMVRRLAASVLSQAEGGKRG